MSIKTTKKITTMAQIDLSIPVQFINPAEGEEDLIFKVTNYNDVTNRVYITPINSTMSIPGEELFSITDIQNI